MALKTFQMETRGRENTARRSSTGVNLHGDCFSRALFASCFGIWSSNWRSSWLRLRPWRGREDAVDTAVQGTTETWDRLTRFMSCVRESVGFCLLVIPELVQADIWKHTTPAICCSVSQGNSLLTIRHRAHPVAKADKVCLLAARRPVRCAHRPSLGEASTELSALFYPGNLPFPGTSRWPWTDE